MAITVAFRPNEPHTRQWEINGNSISDTLMLLWFSKYPAGSEGPVYCNYTSYGITISRLLPGFVAWWGLFFLARIPPNHPSFGGTPESRALKVQEGRCSTRTPSPRPLFISQVSEIFWDSCS